MNVGLTVLRSFDVSTRQLGSFHVATRQLEYIVDNMAYSQENSSEVPILHLKSSDSVIFDVELPIAKRLKVIKTMIDSLGEENLDEALPLQLKSDTLTKVIEFATHHKNDPMPRGDDTDKKTEMTEWDQQFLTADLNTLCELTLAANYLDMKDLLDLVTRAIGRGHFKDQSPDAMRETSKILLPQ